MIVDAAASRPAETIALMLELGFSPDARNGFGEQPMHSAAYQGNAAVVGRTPRRRRRGRRPRRAFRGDSAGASPPSAAASRPANRANGSRPIRLLIEAGACRDGVWITGKPPSEEVAELLRHYGITPGEPTQQRAAQPAEPQDPADETQAPRSVGTRGDGRGRPPPRSRLPRRGSRPARIPPAPRGHLDRPLSQQGAGPRLVSQLSSRRNRRHREQRGSRPRRGRARPQRVPPRRGGPAGATTAALPGGSPIDGGEIVDIRFYPDRRSAFAH